MLTSTSLSLRLKHFDTAIGGMLVVSDGEARGRAIDWVGYESRMLRLLRCHYGAAGAGFTLEDAALPGWTGAPLVAYFGGDLGALDGIGGVGCLVDGVWRWWWAEAHPTKGVDIAGVLGLAS